MATLIDPLATAASAVTVLTGITALIVHRRMRKALPRQNPPSDLLILPFSFTVDVVSSVPSVEVEFYALNIAKRPLTLTDLKVTNLSIPDCPPLAQIFATQEFQLDPQRPLLVSCRRHLLDSEARAVDFSTGGSARSGSVSMVARARGKRTEYSFGPVVAQRISGRVNHPLASANRQMQSEAERDPAETEKLKAELTSTENDRDGWRNSALSHEQDLRYGQPLPAMKQLSEAEYIAIRPALEELQHNLEAALNSAERVWDHLSAECNHRGDAKAEWWLEKFLRERAREKTLSIAGLYSEQLKFNRDARPALAVLYSSYRNWRDWLVRLGVLLGQPAAGAPGYAKWREADERFLEELRRKIRIKQLEEVAEAVDWFDKHRVENNDPLPPATV